MMLRKQKGGGDPNADHLKPKAVPRTATVYRSARPIAIAGMLGAVSIMLGISNLGIIFIPPMSITIMHIPVLIGAIAEGPMVGLLTGLIFGLFSQWRAFTGADPTAPLFMDPLVSVLPRLLIGLAAWAVARLIRKRKDFAVSTKRLTVSTVMGAVIGSLINTVSVLGMIYLRHLGTYAGLLNLSHGEVLAAMALVAARNGIAEAIVAALISAPVIMALNRRTNR